MADYTHRDVLSKNKYFHKDIGGIKNKIKKDRKYLDNQIDLIKNDDKKPIKYNPYDGYLKEQGLEEIDTIKQYQITYININSADRIKTPIVATNESFLLDNNPLTFTNGSNIMEISHINHTYQINDRIYYTSNYNSNYNHNV